MTTTLNDFLSTLDGTTKTTTIYQAIDTNSVSRRSFEVHVRGTFVGRLQLLVSYDGGTNWAPVMTFESPAQVTGLKTIRPNAQYKLSWDDAVTGDSGGYTSGSAEVFVGLSSHDSRSAYSFTKLLDKAGRMFGLSGNPLVVQGDQITTKTATVANTASLSAAVDCGLARLARIVMPATFEGTSLTFQSSPDGVTYNNVYNDAGAEYSVVCGTSRSIGLNLADFLGVRFLKVRSGSSGSPTVVAADRALTLVLVP